MNKVAKRLKTRRSSTATRLGQADENSSPVGLTPNFDALSRRRQVQKTLGVLPQPSIGTYFVISANNRFATVFVFLVAPSVLSRDGPLGFAHYVEVVVRAAMFV